MKFKTDYPLLNLNTLHLESYAKYFIELKQISELTEIFDLVLATKLPWMVLGGGSNLILPKHYNGVVVANQLQGIKLIEQTPDAIYVEAYAGENWDNFVKTCIDNGWYGLENLSKIPGVVGASPIQNIGAYGVEVKDFIDHVTVYDVETKQTINFDNVQCNFTYRNSYFKTKHNLVILAVTFKLRTTPKLSLTYADLAKRMEEFSHPTPLNLREVVAEIRANKLPDPSIIGNVGSFFHNPIIDIKQFNQLHQKYPNLVSYKVDQNKVKISAGWLIDNLGLKGYSAGDLAVYEKQALVIVNRGVATQEQVLEFAKTIQVKVWDNYQIHLNIEPIVVE